MLEKDLKILTTDLVLSIRAVMVLFKWTSFADASVKTNISVEDGAMVRASCEQKKKKKKNQYIAKSQVFKFQLIWIKSQLI